MYNFKLTFVHLKMEVLVLPNSIASDITSIPIDKLYYSLIPKIGIDAKLNQEYLTAVFLQIIQYERYTFELLATINKKVGVRQLYGRDKISLLDEARKNYVLKRVIPDIEIISNDELVSRLNFQLDYYALNDIFGKDSDVNNKHYDDDDEPVDTFSVILLVNGEYMTHTNCWIDNKSTISMQGIRTSMFNTLSSNSVKGTSYIVVDALITYARAKKFHNVLVIEPLLAMKHVLEKCGFHPILQYHTINYIFKTSRDPNILGSHYILTIL